MPDRSICESVVRQLWPYLDGAVSETERDRIVDHLEQCAMCTSHFDFAQAFLEAVSKSGPRIQVDVALHDRVLRALVAEGFSATAR